MVYQIDAHDAPTAYHESLYLVKVAGALDHTRNGGAIALQAPFVLSIRHPEYRVIRCPVRNANPFFHVMETVWMLAGQRHTAWIEKFNSRIGSFADDGIMHGAYGYRWLQMWGNQIRQVYRTLRKDPASRQCVISMWDPMSDNYPHWKDRPCNTHIYFRVRDGVLDMSVCNRSNDLVWGMFGSNIVHMTYLQEFIAIAAGLELGHYHVFTNNLHIYTDRYPNGKDIRENLVEGPNPYAERYGGYETFPILHHADAAESFLRDCEYFITSKWDKIGSPWLLQVAKPMHDAYLAQTYEGRMAHASLIEAKDWRTNCEEWLRRKYGKDSSRS